MRWKLPLALLAAMLLATGCGGQDAAAEPTPGTTTLVGATAPAHGSAQNETIAFDEANIYQLVWDDDLNVLLHATPANGGGQRLLCEESGCLHNNADCPAWYGNNTQGRLFSINGTLLVVTEDTETGNIQFTSICKDGSGKQALASLPASQLACDYVALHGNSLYFVQNKGTYGHVTRLDVTTSENGTVMSLASNQGCIGGAGEAPAASLS